jgi:hypothetical protein
MAKIKSELKGLWLELLMAMIVIGLVFFVMLQWIERDANRRMKECYEWRDQGIMLEAWQAEQCTAFKIIK